MLGLFGKNKRKVRGISNSFRVAYLIQYFEPGGLERMVCTLAEGMHRQGMAAWVVGYYRDGGYRKEFEKAGIQTVFLNEGDGIRWRLPFRLARWMTDERIDILHTHHLGPYLYGMIASWLTGIPLVHTEHSREFYDSVRMRLLGRTMNHFAEVIAVTPELSRWRTKQFGKPVKVIPNGVSIPGEPGVDRSTVLRELEIPFDSFVIGCVARLAPEKNHAGLLKAFSDVVKQYPRSVLVLVGDGPLSCQISTQINALGIKNHVRMLGYRDNVERLLSGFDLAVLASEREGLPLALLEAMAHGVPVVASAVGGIPDLLQDGGGIPVQPGDYKAMAEGIKFFIDNSPERQRHAQLARQVVFEKYSSQKMIERHLRLYRQIIWGRGAE